MSAPHFLRDLVDANISVFLPLSGMPPKPRMIDVWDGTNFEVLERNDMGTPNEGLRRPS